MKNRRKISRFECVFIVLLSSIILLILFNITHFMRTRDVKKHNPIEKYDKPFLIDPVSIGPDSDGEETKVPFIKRKNKGDDDDVNNNNEKQEERIFLSTVPILDKEDSDGNNNNNNINKNTVKEKYKLYIIRHGEAEHNVGRCEDFRDPKLTEKGIKQAQMIKENEVFKNRKDDPDVVFFSPLSRTIETTYYGFDDLIFNENSKTRFLPNEFLQENYANEYSCDTGSDIEYLEDKYPFLDYRSLRDDWYVPLEDKTERRRKFRKYLRNYLEENPNTNYGVIIAHQGTINGLLELRRGRSLENAKPYDCEFIVNEEKIVCEGF